MILLSTAHANTHARPALGGSLDPLAAFRVATRAMPDPARYRTDRPLAMSLLTFKLWLSTSAHYRYGSTMIRD